MKLRRQILDILENANSARLAGRHDEVRRLLNFVIVGGGPTGVEFAAEFSDFVYFHYQICFRNFENFDFCGIFNFVNFEEKLQKHSKRSKPTSLAYIQNSTFRFKSS